MNKKRVKTQSYYSFTPERGLPDELRLRRIHPYKARDRGTRLGIVATATGGRGGFMLTSGWMLVTWDAEQPNASDRGDTCSNRPKHRGRGDKRATQQDNNTTVSLDHANTAPWLPSAPSVRRRCISVSGGSWLCIHFLTVWTPAPAPETHAPACACVSFKGTTLAFI